jgi:predicted O-linked N-acetylglucosamine transferase (SPINDLY family)
MTTLRIARPAPPPVATGAKAPGPGKQTPKQRAAHKAWQLGVQRAREGQLADAAKALRQAVQDDPKESLYWLNLASVTHKMGRVDESMDSARRAFELDRGNILACHLAAELLRLNSRYTEMLQTLLALNPATPRDAQHHLLTGAAHMELANWQDAAVAFLQVLSMKPADQEAYSQLGMALARLGRYADAAECYRTIVMLHPKSFAAAVYAAHYAGWSCDWPGFKQDLARLEKARELIGDGENEEPFSPFCLLSMNDDAALHRWAAALDASRIARYMRSLPNAAAYRPLWERSVVGPAAYPGIDVNGRTRVGLVSSDFRTHATSILLVQVLELLDRERFEIVLYSHGKDDGTPLRQRMVALADKVVETAEVSLIEQAEMVRQDGITILVDFNGFTQGSRLGLFSLRPAPVQVLWLAYPSTTGSDFMDYIVGDPTLTPLEHQADFSERIAQLPVCYEPTDRLRERPAKLSRAECGLPEDAFVFACFNQSYKLTEEMFGAWCRILQRTPGSVFWLLVPQADVQARLREAAQQRGVDPARLIFAPFVSPQQHMARLPQADLFLDTFPYGAHTTCNDALWMGLPVLALKGRSFSARVAASLLRAVELSDLVCDTPEHYENMAVALFSDRQTLQAVRAHLETRCMDLPLFDTPRFTQELGALFDRMTARWKAGLPPQALPAEPLHQP